MALGRKVTKAVYTYIPWILKDVAKMAVKMEKLEDTTLGQLTNYYLHDVTLPFGIYFFNSLLTEFNKNSFVSHPYENRLFNIAWCFGGCSAFEIAQGLGLYKGTFDPLDFVAYALGTSLAVVVDKLTFSDKKEYGLEYKVNS